MRRLFLAGVMQETNDFSPIPTAMADFFAQSWDPESGTPAADRDLLGYGAVLEGAGAHGFRVSAAPFYSTWPAMPTNLATWHALRDRILADLEQAMPVDAVFLFLHGAMSAWGEHDCEGDLIAEIRRRVGPAVPIAAEYDLHGNVSRRMLTETDFTLACLEYPHIDHAERSLKCVALLKAKLDEAIAPVTVALSVPAVGIFSTREGPMKDMVDRLRGIETRPGILAVSMFHGFFGADNPDMGACAVVIADGDAALARTVAEEIAADFATTAQQIPQRAAGVEEALDQAEASATPLVVIADRADNAGGGAAADNTHILRAAIDRKMQGVAMGLFWDKMAVELIHAAGVGATLPVRIGGKVGPMSGDPVDLVVEVLSVRTDAKQAWFGKGEPRLSLGASAAVCAGGITLILCSNRQQAFSRHIFTEHGIDPHTQRVLVVKSTAHFYNDFSKLTDSIILCDAPGTVTSDYASLPYANISRPKWPIDADRIGPARTLYEG